MNIVRENGLQGSSTRMNLQNHISAGHYSIDFKTSLVEEAMRNIQNILKCDDAVCDSE